MNSLNILIILGLISILSCKLTNGECLPPKDCAFVGCCCSYTSIGIDINCASNSSEEKPSFPNRQDTDKTQILRLTIFNYDFSELPSKAFNGLEIKTIRLYDNNLKVIRQDSFTGLSGLEELTIEEESAIEIIEPNSFDPIKNSLLKLVISNQTSIDLTLLNSNSFPNLNSLTMKNITKLNPEWFVNLPKLTTLVLSDNPNIEEYPKNFFTSNRLLENIYLDRNNLIPLVEVFNWLGVIKDQIKSISLKSNRIPVLPTEIDSFSNLVSLDLSSNSIEWIPNMRFKHMSNLSHVDLSHNRLQGSLDAFKNNSRLKSVILAYNELSEIHEISAPVEKLDYDNQNGKLVEIKDYAFDYNREPWSYNMWLLLRNNKGLVKFGNRTFCSRTDTASVKVITTFNIDYESLVRMNLCLLRQFGLRNRKDWSNIIVENAPQPVSSSELCNCDFIDFLTMNSIEMSLVGCGLNHVCNGSSIIAKRYDSECAAKKEFQCLFSNTNGLKSLFQFDIAFIGLLLLFLLQKVVYL